MEACYRRNRSAAKSIILQLRATFRRKSRDVFARAVVDHRIFITAIVNLAAHRADDVIFDRAAGIGFLALLPDARGIRRSGHRRPRLGHIVPKSDARNKPKFRALLDEHHRLQAGLVCMSPEEIFVFLQQWHIALPIVLAAMAAFFFTGHRWSALYVGLMPFINWSFAAVETYPIPDWLGGGMFQPLAIVTGLVLVVRDFAQRELKHWVWGAMITGLLLSTLTSWITIVVASALAFLISETVDWAVYTFSNRPLSQRIMISSLASAPLDQVVFIGLASLVVPDIFAWGTVLTGIISKLLGAWIVSRIVAVQERRRPQNDMNPA
jgi:uncharacterized PurR-regulated membrane protein YhhQ (DUF165 family)